MMRYLGSIIGAGLLAGVLSNSSAGHADFSTFRLVGLVVVSTAALAVIAASFIHKFAETTLIPVTAPEAAPASS
jgi:hypothetical protein